MKTLIKNSNPFVMLLIPVMFALILGVSYQFKQKKESSLIGTSVHATSLFYKGVTLIKTVCTVAKDNNLW
ncbi:hypothetical protein [Mucilaginibacter pocheonensis]|uniref:Uncharacterized protein n=1 Tax=Mucilaginibacter pocheonensis TaxID=398050 RepID=A0ABU1TCX7_9SPHI|nr:hypothetical protein [Mucilaginibacter pocheonensis]MDR6942690.1 hypothetical protein [Mucilaginibacter pocheonensis]